MSTFVNQSFGTANYAKYRPTYPEGLYEHVLDYHKTHGQSAPKSTVDLACGTGQATKVLGNYSERVLGVDHSEVMVIEARKQVTAPNVSFDVCKDVELVPKLGEKSVDLLTAAEAAHYFKYPAFWEQAAAVLKPGGTLAIWSYWTFAFPDYPEVAKIIDDYAYADDQCGPYWDDGRTLLNEEYKYLMDTIPQDKFGNIEYRVNHFDEFRPEEPFELVRRDLDVGGIIHLLKTWSPYFNWKSKNADKPDIADAVMDKIHKATGLTESDKVTVKWNTVYILATRK